MFKGFLRRFWKILFALFLVFFVCLIGIVVYCIHKYYPSVSIYWQEAKAMVEDSKPTDFKGNQIGYIYASNGTQLAELKSGVNTIYVEYKDLPEYATKAFIAIEDKRFFEHKGVDWKSTCKAAYLLLKRNGDIVRGGSTITQQLARNHFLTFEISYERKFREIFTALQLEQKYSKTQVLEFYVNNINYGNGCYGFGTAAMKYFGKSASELNLAETAFLAAIPNNPTYYNPLENLSNTINRQLLILDQMCKQGFITESDKLAAKNTPIHLLEEKTKSEMFYNWETSYAIDCAVRLLMQHNNFDFKYTFDTMQDYKSYREVYLKEYELAREQLMYGGYKVFTSIDLKLQNELQSQVDSNLKIFKQKNKEGFYKMQAAATLIDNRTGLVCAIVGGRKQKYEALSFNRAYQSYRQPGSTIKPLIVYTPSLEHGYTSKTIVSDTQIVDGPKNSNGIYSGDISLEQAVAQSKNVVAWRLLQELSPRVGLKYLQNMKYTKIVPNDYFLPAALGGLYYGVNTVEMASGYYTIANDGEFKEATCIISLETASGRELVKEKDTIKIFKKNASREMTNLLEGVIKRGTAYGLKVRNLPIAGKTGTTNNQTLGWFCGYTPYYTAAVWVGTDDNTSTEGLWGSTYPMAIWSGIQNFATKGKAYKKFDKIEKADSSPMPSRNKEEEPIVDSLPVNTPEPISTPKAPVVSTKPPLDDRIDSEPIKKPETEPEASIEPKPTIEPEASIEPKPSIVPTPEIEIPDELQDGGGT